MHTLRLRTRSLGLRVMAVLLALVVAGTATWVWLAHDTVAILPVPKTARLASFVNSCNVAATVWETTVIYGAIADPPAGIAYAIGTWALQGFGAYATADACATDIGRSVPRLGSCWLLSPGRYKGTNNGAKYYYPGTREEICTF